MEIRPRRTTITFPANDGLTLALVSSAIAEFPRIQLDHEAAYLTEPQARVKAGRRKTRVVVTADLPDFFRRLFGPGWRWRAMRGYHQDALTAQGITDAFHQAEMLAKALSGSTGRYTSTVNPRLMSMALRFQF